MKLFLSLALFAAFLLCPAACAEGVRDGLSLAAGRALPALVPFFLASGLLVRTGFAETFGRLLARPLARLYRLPPAAASAVLLGLTGGYPVGAATAAALLEQGALRREEAARVNLFCNCASPGFCIGLVGLGVFGSARTWKCTASPPKPSRKEASVTSPPRDRGSAVSRSSPFVSSITPASACP